MRVFARKGYHTCRVGDIAEEAGVAHGLLYHYFRSKEELLETIFRETWRDLLDAVRSVEETDESARDRLAGIAKIQGELGHHRVSALMTTTEASLPHVKEIIDTYWELGLHEVFLRPISPYGFAVRTKSHARYDTDRWLRFYDEGLDYILELNRQGTPMEDLGFTPDHEVERLDQIPERVEI